MSLYNIIAHRANLDGPSAGENSPEQVEKALELGFDVEIDVWCINDYFYLGHDYHQYCVDGNFLLQKGLWCHAKNLRALELLLGMGAHCFFHDKDPYTLTSDGYIWVYPGYDIGAAGTVLVMPEWMNTDFTKFSYPRDLYGICTDYPTLLEKSL